MQKFREILLADIADDPDRLANDPNGPPPQMVAHFKGVVPIKAKHFRNRIIEFSRVLTAEELPGEITVAEQAEAAGEIIHISSRQLRKGQAALELEHLKLDCDLFDGTDLLQSPRPHYKYRGVLKPGP